MKRTGIFGGTFDPIHTGHLIIAEQARESLDLEKVLFIPNGNPPHKQGITFTDKKYRLEMLKLAIEDNKNFEVSEIETAKSELSYTVDTLKELKKIINSELFFIMGADSLINIKTWHKYEELLELSNFIVFSRVFSENHLKGRSPEIKGWDKNSLQSWIINNLSVKLSKFYFIDFPVLEVSSTVIRRKLSDRKSVKYLVPSKVIEYICKKSLY